ncbi:MAG TPA: hypothetical protein VGK67_21210 [Myxococcales bacterium]|jgi:hypothetical protein
MACHPRGLVRASFVLLAPLLLSLACKGIGASDGGLPELPDATQASPQLDASLPLPWTPGPFRWVATWGPGLTIKDAALDPSGNLYVTGTFLGTVDLDPGPGEFPSASGTALNGRAFLTKLSPDGQHLWSRAFDPHLEFAAAAFSPSGTSCIAGRFTEPNSTIAIDFDPGDGADLRYGIGRAQGFVTCLAADGSYRFSSITDARSFVHNATAAAFEPGGDLLVSFLDPNTYSNIVRVHPDGSADPLVVPLAPLTMGLAPLSTGDLLTYGTFIGEADLDPTAGVDRWRTVSWDCSGIPMEGVVVSRFGADWSYGWTTGLDNAERPLSAVVDAQGRTYLATLFGNDCRVDGSPKDGMARRVDLDGTIAWQNRLPAPMPRYETSAVDPRGAIYFAGSFAS